MVATSEQHNSWDLMQDLHSLSTLLWLIFGDFNEVLLAFEKTGGRSVTLSNCRVVMWWVPVIWVIWDFTVMCSHGKI